MQTSDRPTDEADLCPDGGDGFPLLVTLSPARYEQASDRARAEQRNLAGLVRRALFVYLDQAPEDAS